MDAFRAAHRALVELTADSHEHEENPDAPSTVQSMPIVLHLPKQDPPDRIKLLEAAARAVVACCLDERAGCEGDYATRMRSWYGARIRKVARRARNVHWQRAQQVPGVTIQVGEASARAIVPSAIVDTDPLIAKLQIGGTTLPPSAHTYPERPVPLVAVRKGLEMSVGKQAAQVGHGSMLLAARMTTERAYEWACTGFDLQVIEADEAMFIELAQRDGAVVIQDAGFTEIAPGSYTVVAIDRG